MTDSRSPRTGPKSDSNYAVREGKHRDNGFRHLSSITGACLCEDSCCFGSSGCRCGQCSGVGHESCPNAWALMPDRLSKQ
jgi:hypothetical protein